MLILEDIKAFLEFIIVKIIIFSQEIMHIQQVRISHVFDKLRSHSFRRIFHILLSEFLYDLRVDRYDFHKTVPFCLLLDQEYDTGRRKNQAERHLAFAIALS